MADNEKLQLGLSLQVDLDAFETEWKNKQRAIQNIIDGHTFNIKIGGVQGLDAVRKEMENFSRGVKASTKVDLVNTDSIKGLKDQLRALEQEWANLSKQQKFANESTRELTPYAVELATRYAELRAELERYGMSLKEAEKAGRSFAANRARIAAEDITQPDFELLQMAEYYKIVERESAKAYEARMREQEAEAKMGESLAQAVILQNQMTQARNADYAALVKQLAAEEKLAETLHNESLRREAYQSMGQRDFIFDQMAEYYKQLNTEMEKQAQITASANKLYVEDLAIKERAGKVLAEAVIAQNQMEQARNADYAALKKQLQAESELAEKMREEALYMNYFQNMGQRDFSIEQMKTYYEQLEESSRLAKEASDAEARRGEQRFRESQRIQAEKAKEIALQQEEYDNLIRQIQEEATVASNAAAQRGAARFRESQRIQEAKTRELRLQQEEYEALRKQLREEAKLASMQKNRRDNERYTSQQRRISEGKRIQQILTTEVKTLDAINQRLAIQRQRLGEAAIGSAKYKKIEKDIAALEARLRSLDDTQRRSTSITDAQTNAFQRQSGVLNGLKQFMNSYISLLGGYRLMSNIKQITSEFELQRVSLRAITQDAQFADALFAKIKATATESPFSTKDLVTYTKQLSAYRIENEELYGTMNMLADVSAGLGVSMDRLILAYGQVKAASVLRGTELRQFTEAGIPLVDELAKKFSQLRGEVVSTGEVFDLISTRQVPFEMVADIFKEMTAEGGRFYEMQKKQSESLYGVFENLKDVIQNTFDEIGQSNRGLLMGIGKLATVGAKNLNILTAAIAPLIVGMGAYRAATVLATKGTLGLSVSTNLLARAEQSLALAGRQVMIGRAKSVGLLKKAKAANDAYALSVIRAYRATNIFAKSFHLLKAAIIANPIGAIITALTAAYSAFSAYSDKLASVSGAHERAAKAIEETKKAIESEPKFTAFKSLSNDLKKQESLLKSTKLSYKDFMKIYPELAKEFESEADWKKALNSADIERQKILSQIKDAYPEYFSYLDIEKGKVEDLAKGYAKMEESMRLKQAALLEDRAQGLDADIEKLEGKRDSWLRKFWYGSDMKLFGVDAPFLAELTGKQEEVKAIRAEIDALKKASQDASDAAVKWRQNYKQLVMGGFMEDQALATLQFGDAVENAQKKANELREDIDRLQRIPPAELEPSLVNKLEKIKSEYADIIKFLKMYNQELDKANKKGAKTKLQELRSEFQMVQKIYKEYEDLRKVLGDDAAAEEIKKAYSAVTNIDFLSPSLYKKRLKMLADAVAKTHVTIRKSSADLTGQQISDTKKWTKAYEEQLKIWEQSGKVATKAYKVKDKDGKPQGNWTVGWGFENLIDEAGNWKKVTEDTTMTLEEANKQLQLQLQYRSGLLDKVLSTYQDLELTANQYSALLDIVFNTKGEEKNVDKILKAVGGDINKIPELLKDAFTRAAATGEQMPGLVDRAAGRAAMFAADLSSAISQQFSKISIDSVENLPSYLAMLIQKAIGDVDIDGITQRMEAMLNQISQQIKQQQDASDFFEKMLGLTGDVELSTKLTLGVTGVELQEGGVSQLLAQQLAEILTMAPIAAAVPTDFVIDGKWDSASVQKAIQEGELTVSQIQEVIANLTAMGKDDLAKSLEGALASFVDYNKQLVNEVYSTLAEYGDFADKIELIKAQTDVTTKVRPPEVDDAAWAAYTAALQRKQDEAVAAINFDKFKKEFAKQLSNLDIVASMTLDTIHQKLVDWMTQNAGKASEADVKAVLELIEKIDNIKVSRNPFKEWWSAWEDLNAAKKKGDTEAIEEAFNKLKAVSKVSSKSIAAMSNAISGVIDGALDLADTLGIAFSDDTQEMIEAFRKGLKLVAPIMTLVGASMIFAADAAMALQAAILPLLAITLALSAAFAAINWLSNKKVRAANKEIERQERLLKNLERAYDRLEETQEELVGTDWVRNQQQQIANLQKQISAFEAQREAEQSKGKKRDDDAIEDYTDKILDAQKQIRELQRGVTEEMLGTGLPDAAKDFAQSWLDAYLSFDDTMGALKASFKDMMKTMVQNSMMAKLVQKRLEPVFAAIDRAYEDAELTPAEWQSIMDMGNRAIEYIDDDLTHLAEMLGLRNQLGEQDTSNLTGIAKGVAQASEETVLTLAGYANSILYYQVWIKDDVAAIRAIMEGKVAAVTPAGNDGGFNVGQLVTLQQQSLNQLQAINANTGNTVSQLQELNNKIDSVISAQGTPSRKVLNTRLSN